MSARSARRTRRRRWRMGRDRAGEREMRRTHGRRLAAKHLSSRGGSVAFCFSHPRTSSFIRTPKCFPPCCFPSTFRFHGPHRVWIRFGNFLPFLMPTAGWKNSDVGRGCPFRALQFARSTQPIARGSPPPAPRRTMPSSLAPAARRPPPRPCTDAAELEYRRQRLPATAEGCAKGTRRAMLK